MSLSARAQSEVGQILAAKVEGEVIKLAADGSTTPLTNGDKITETDTVTTGKGASIVLVFMNGSSVKLGEESRLAIDEFKMDPLADDLDVASLKAEPTVSQTKLNLSYGEMVGDVKKLSKDSNYTINTPVGAAGIRGTIYRIVFKPAANGKAFFTIQTAEGHVVYQSTEASPEVSVLAGKEVVVEIDVPDTPDQTPAAPVIVTEDISDANKTAIAGEVEAITQTLQITTFTKTTTTTTGTTSTTTTETKVEVTDKTTNEKTTTVLPPTQTTQQLTPGAGK